MSSFRCKMSSMRWKFTQKDKDENVKLRTHNLMDGGELSVPDSEYDRFLKLYSECICDGEKLYVVEQRSHPAYRLFFDFDLFLDEMIESNEYYINICKLIVATINELCDDSLDHFDIICSIAEVKKVKKCQKECYKHGVHITSADIYVDKEKMMKIREAVVQKFSNNLSKEGPTSWEDDIDKVVYESSGFRMLFSRKGSRCKCSQKERDMCDRCEGTGKVDEGRPYVPLLTMNSSYACVLYPADRQTSFDFVYEMLQKTSIRCAQSSISLVEFNKSAPSWFEDSSLFVPPEDMIIASSSKRRKVTEGIVPVESKLEQKLDLSTEDLKTFNTWFQLMCQKKQLPKQYKGIEVTSAFSFTTNNVRSNMIARIDSSYCINIGREHSTNTVYMLVNTLTKKAVMKCYCRCDTTEGRRTIVNGKKQMCKDFTSHAIDASDLKLQITCGVTKPINPRILAMF